MDTLFFLALLAKLLLHKFTTGRYLELIKRTIQIQT
jgi:hypothetical protein